MTATLEGVQWSAALLGHTLPPGKTRYLLYRKLGGSQGRSGRAENFVPTGIRSRTVQPVVSRYTDWATWPTLSGYSPNKTEEMLEKLSGVTTLQTRSCSSGLLWVDKLQLYRFRLLCFLLFCHNRSRRSSVTGRASHSSTPSEAEFFYAFKMTGSHSETRIQPIATAFNARLNLLDWEAVQLRLMLELFGS